MEGISEEGNLREGISRDVEWLNEDQNFVQERTLKGFRWFDL
jgi:hypothetical protein